MDLTKHVLPKDMIPGLERVLLLNGVVRSADAISRSLLLKQEALMSAFGEHVQVDIAAYDADPGVLNAHHVSGLVDLLALPIFRQADLLIYEFGIWYQLFDSVRFAPKNARTVAVWHNITPPELAADSAGRALMERSLAQMSNMWCCDHICCDSAFNATALEGLGYDSARISVLNLPIHNRLLQAGVKPRGRTCLSLLFVGRFVPSKGVLDLVRAAAAAASRVPCDVELSLAGNVGFSEPAYLKALHAEIAITPMRITFRGNLNDADLAAAFLGADILIMPSYHEGYCVPIIEAFAAGCHVVAYDAGNLPSLVGQYGEIVPTGDVAALTDSLTDCLVEHSTARAENREPAFRTGAGRVAEGQRRRRVRRYAAGFSEVLYAEDFLSCVAHVFTQPRLPQGRFA